MSRLEAGGKAQGGRGQGEGEAVGQGPALVAGELDELGDGGDTGEWAAEAANEDVVAGLVSARRRPRLELMTLPDSSR